MGEDAARLVAMLTERGLTVAVAESLTGGQLCAALTEVPGASAAVRGGVVAYATATKHTVLGVDAALVAGRGPVDPDVAVAMAEGVRRRFDADLGVATTGVAGPEPQDGHPVGEVYVALADSRGATVERLALAGDRADIQRATVGRAVQMVLARLETDPSAADGEASG
jgi:nicotinamide-nucleotide amidase